MRENVIYHFAHHDLSPALPKHLLANHGTGFICSKTIRENFQDSSEDGRVSNSSWGEWEFGITCRFQYFAFLE